jgi:hypothetical protein
MVSCVCSFKNYSFYCVYEFGGNAFSLYSVNHYQTRFSCTCHCFMFCFVNFFSLCNMNLVANQINSNSSTDCCVGLPRLHPVCCLLSVPSSRVTNSIYKFGGANIIFFLFLNQAQAVFTAQQCLRLPCFLLSLSKEHFCHAF